MFKCRYYTMNFDRQTTDKSVSSRQLLELTLHYSLCNWFGSRVNFLNRSCGQNTQLLVVFRLLLLGGVYSALVEAWPGPARLVEVVTKPPFEWTKTPAVVTAGRPLGTSESSRADCLPTRTTGTSRCSGLGFPYVTWVFSRIGRSGH